MDYVLINDEEIVIKSRVLETGKLKVFYLNNKSSIWYLETQDICNEHFYCPYYHKLKAIKIEMNDKVIWEDPEIVHKRKFNKDFLGYIK